MIVLSLTGVLNSSAGVEAAPVPIPSLTQSETINTPGDAQSDDSTPPTETSLPTEEPQAPTDTSQPPGGNTPPTDTPVPPPNPAANATSFTDNFSDPSSGWPEQHDALSDMGYFQGATYSLVIKSPSKMLIAIAPDKLRQPIQDIVVKVRGKQSGPEAGAFGLVCRWQDNQNFYAAVVMGDQFRIDKMVKGKYTALTEPAWQPLTYAKPDVEGYHTLVLSCNGGFIVLEVDGMGAAHVTDEDLSQGKAGLTAVSGAKAGPDGVYFSAIFDDFSETLP